jgi:hypothetical protein
MVQSTDITLSPGISGTEERTELNDILAAILSNHSGASRPGYLTDPGYWTKEVSGTVYESYFFDGTDDILIGTLNTSANTFVAAGQLGTFGSIVASKTGSFSASITDFGTLFSCNATSGNITATIGATADLGTTWFAIYQKTDASANTITIDPDSADTINGATTITLSNQDDAIIVIKATSSTFVGIYCPGVGDLARLSTVFNYITSLTGLTAPDKADLFALYDTSAGAGRKITVEDLFKVINTFTADTSPDGATDYIQTYDNSATSAKRVLLNNLFKIINTLSVIAPDTANDYIPFYDVSGAVAGKCLLSAILPSAVVTPTIQVFATPGAGTWNRPSGCKKIKVTNAAAGGGSRAGGGGAAGDGGDTNFGAHCSATGGKAGTISGGGLGGEGIDGDLNINGSDGGQHKTDGTNQRGIALGGSSFLAGSSTQTGKDNGGGAGIPSISGSSGAGYAGGGGGTSIKYIDVTAISSVSLVVGAGGTAGGTGYVGGAGVIIVEEYYA